jgi:hypothetical protein
MKMILSLYLVNLLLIGADPKTHKHWQKRVHFACTLRSLALRFVFLLQILSCIATETHTLYSIAHG